MFIKRRSKIKLQATSQRQSGAPLADRLYLELWIPYTWPKINGYMGLQPFKWCYKPTNWYFDVQDS